MELVIERAKHTDAEKLVKIFHAAYSANEKLGFPSSASKVEAEEVREWINNMMIYIGKEKRTNIIIGTIRLKYSEEWQCYVLSRLAVNPSHRGKGIATKLMKYGESKLLKMGEKRIRLTVAKTHPYLPKMYSEKGYEIVGERIFQELPYDELIMEKLL
ncbi:GNAT family N-acetyltransferase [Sporosarcina sp. Marseille-Q4943]|uniref:GNAT family N-acetyltransferase n=1 Tax=Sporosarcina sp. Marseille-Q4943 TaxID=2942204 RepID=UPI00208DDCD1|nr:GNAT family N-acetyltransferase [Sporosarcina sp. Marseille-Q4943]